VVKYVGVNHVAVVTGDMDRTIRFWRDLLGLRLVVAIGEPGYRHYFFEVAPGCMVAFFEWPQVEPVPEKDHGVPVKGQIAFDHLAIGVESEDDLWALKLKVEAAGFWVSEVIDHGFIHSIYAFDPNGIPIEFSWSVTGVDVHARPVSRDKLPSEVASEGSEPQPDVWSSPSVDTPREERKIYPGHGAHQFEGWKT
jgi:catechol 2,3-dioxygenase-like lactoylglutathione lyase family enzyme